MAHRVDGSALPLEPEDRRVLGQVGELLGASSAEGQLAQLAQCQRLLEEQRAQAQEEKTSKGNLFRSLGMLGGAGLFHPIFVTIEKPRRLQSGSRRGGQPMDVDLIFKIATIGIIVAVLNQVLIRSGREEQAMMTTLAGLIVVLMVMVQEISNLFSTIKSVFGL